MKFRVKHVQEKGISLSESASKKKCQNRMDGFVTENFLEGLTGIKSTWMKRCKGCSNWFQQTDKHLECNACKYVRDNDTVPPKGTQSNPIEIPDWDNPQTDHFRDKDEAIHRKQTWTRTCWTCGDVRFTSKDKYKKDCDTCLTKYLEYKEGKREKFF